MKIFIVFVVLIVLMLAGGGLTAQLLTNSGASFGDGLLPILTQTNLPDASPTTILPWKAEQFFLLVSFVLFNLIGIAVTLALVIWFLDRGLRRGKATAEATASKQVTAAQTE